MVCGVALHHRIPRPLVWKGATRSRPLAVLYRSVRECFCWQLVYIQEKEKSRPSRGESAVAS